MESGWRRMKEIAEQSMNDNNYDIEDVEYELNIIRRDELREKFIIQTIERYHKVLNALANWDTEDEELKYDVITNKDNTYEKLYEKIDMITASELVEIHQRQNTNEDKKFFVIPHSSLVQLIRKPYIE